MEDDPVHPPSVLAAIWADTEAAGFSFPSDYKLGGLLRVLAASKPGGKLLEIGTGTGLATAWLLDGMNTAAHLTSIEANGRWAAIAAKHLRHESRLTLLDADAFSWFGGQAAASYDLVFADAMPGKFDGFDALWRLLKPGGIYVIDDLMPQPSWPADQQQRVDEVLKMLDARTDGRVARMAWAGDVAIAVKLG
ncbi:tRNA 5-hydroxyuridine methyltransferase [Alphaproteobacteria bacterium SO-S41]|nr:tRNA 5-hydroxyuridine methyltransferase [Alphaproteobacteria bacterium SO-S41]